MRAGEPNSATGISDLRPVTYLHLGMIVALMVPLACREASEKPGAASDGTPSVPEVDLTVFEPNVQEQIREAQGTWKTAPEDAEANGRLGMLYHAYELTEAARACYRRATHFAPGDHRWWHLMGQLQSATGEAAAAVKSLKRAYEAKSDYVATPLLLGDLALKDEDMPAAKQWYERVLALDPAVPQAHLGLGRVHIKTQDLDAAIQQFTEAVRHAPTFASGHYALGLAYRAKGDLKKAGEHLAKHKLAVALYPPPDPLLGEVSALRRDVEYLIKPANELMKKKRYAEALQLYREAQKLDPERVTVAYNIGLALEQLGDLDAAAAQFRQVVARWPDNLEAHNSLGTCLRRMNRIEDAAEQFRGILTINTEYAKAYFNLASIAAGQADYNAAIDNYNEGLKRQPEDFFGHLELGMLYARMRKVADALPHFQAAVKLREKDAAARLQLAQALHATGDAEGAITHYRRCLELAPDTAQAGRNLSMLLSGRGDHAGAVKVLRDRLKRARNDQAAMLSLAWILATCPDQTIRNAEEAVRLVEPIHERGGASNPLVLDTLAAAYAGVGRFDDAVKTATLAVQLVAQQASTPATEQMTKAMRERLQGYRNRQPYHAE